MPTKSYVGDTGTVITLDCSADLSGATSLQIAVLKPDDSSLTWQAQPFGLTGMSYTTAAGTFDMEGVWLLQALVTSAAGKWRGETAVIEVSAIFN